MKFWNFVGSKHALQRFDAGEICGRLKHLATRVNHLLLTPSYYALLIGVEFSDSNC